MSYKIPIDLDRYPNLRNLFEDDRASFAELTKGFMSMADNAAENEWHKASKEAFHYPLSKVMLAMMQAIYDYDGIVDHHHSQIEMEALRMLEHENNPLSVLFGDSTPRQANGEKIPLDAFAGTDKPNLKDWFQGLMYAARYVSHKDLAQYLLLGQFDLVELEKAGHIEELLKIQPALQFQKKYDIPLGQRLPGTGFFDLGEDATMYSDDCPACGSVDWNTHLKDDYAFCPDCKGAAYK